MAEYGYVRVSTREQNEARQLAALRKWGIRKRRMVLDKQSGKDFQRPGWMGLMERLQPGDLVVVESIDRLGRSYEEILEQWRTITRDKGADLLILDMPMLDTRAKGQDLTGKFISDMVLSCFPMSPKPNGKISAAARPRASPPPRPGGCSSARPL